MEKGTDDDDDDDDDDLEEVSLRIRQRQWSAVSQVNKLS